MGFLIYNINMKLEDFKNRLIIKIERLRDEVEKDMGTSKYSDSYNECIEIIKNTTINDKHL